MKPKRTEKVAAIVITVAGFGMMLAQVELIRFDNSGYLPTSARVTIYDSLVLLVGVADAVIGISILTRQRWARRALILWTIISLALFTAGTWAGRFFFDWQILSIVCRLCLVLYFSSAGYLLWTGRKRSLEA